MGSTKNLEAILGQIRKASVPTKLTYQQLKEFGYPSSNDRPIIPLMKAMGFLDDSGVPLERYRRFKDGSQWKRVLAEGIRAAYSDVFAIDENAQKLNPSEINGIFARLSEKSEAVTDKMAITFRALSALADFSGTAAKDAEPAPEPTTDLEPVEAQQPDREPMAAGLSLRHDIHLHLPVSDDIKVYDAIFQSLRTNLLP